MGCSYTSQVAHMISIILLTFFILMISLSSSNSSIAHSFHGLQKQFFFMEANVGVEKREASFMHKFRALLGLKSLGGQKGPTLFPNCVSPAPAPAPLPSGPSPAPAPAPAPLQLHHAKPLSLHPRSRLFPHHHHETQKEHKDEGRVRRILVPTLVSAGLAFLAFVLGFVCLCGKKGRIRSNKSKHVMISSQISSSKVSLNPTIDLLYLDAIAVDLEQQDMCFKPDPDILNASSKQVLKPESENGSSSSTKEIMSVHNDDDGGGGGGGGGGDRIIPVDHHFSDDESFHSFSNSHSSNFRLSNASAGSLSDITVEAYQNPQNMTLSPSHSSQCHFAPPPPPPPPPPVARNMHILPPKSSPMKMRSKNSETETNPEISTREKEDEPDQESELKILPDKTGKYTESPSVIPAPPLPPPFLKDKLTTSSTAVKRPPPPPCPLPHHTPLGKDGAPLAKLKPLHWDKVRATPDRTTVWDKLRSSSFELDEEMIESLFGYNAQSSMRNDEARSKTPSPTKHVLESKRLQNMTILLKALNVTAEQVCNALIKGTGLGLQQLEALVRMVPTKEEEAKLLEYKGDINELGSAEKFIKLLIHCIPFAFQRAEAMLYRETFDDEVIHLKNSFSMLEEACKELRSSRLFLKLLEAVLKTGNRMNVGTIRGGARAFKLDALLKLSDVKGTDGGKTTLLHFVVQEIIRSEGMRVSDSIMGQINQKSSKNMIRSDEEREEDYRAMGLDLVSGLSSELYHVKKTASLDLDVLGSSVSNLSDGMAKLRGLVDGKLCGDDDDDEKNGSFVNGMKGFIKYGERKLEELKGDEDRVLLNVREITEYFHGDLSKEEGNPLRIFVIVRDFLGMLDHVCKELRSLKVASTPSPLAPFR